MAGRVLSPNGSTIPMAGQRCLARFARLLCLVLFCNAALPSHSGTEATLQSQYQQFLDVAYAEISGATVFRRSSESAYETLLKDILQASGVEAIAIASANLSAIEDNISHPSTIDLVRYLLQQDAVFLVERLAEPPPSDPYFLAKLHFELAKFHLNRNDWGKSAEHLQKVRPRNALTQEQRDYTDIMTGMLRQQDAHHREAIPFYEAVGPESPHYPVAQLNLATVHIRQDWWTDGHIAIQKALRRSTDKDLRDRLYTVLGFSQLQQGFYRDARHSFRQVRTRSLHSQRALFGLGVAALHQGDYPAALNAFGFLKDADTYSKSSAEAFLLSAVTLEYMEEFGAASAEYTEALAHYENRIRNLNAAITAFTQSASSLDRETLARHSLVNRAPDHLTAAIDHLSRLRETSLSTGTRSQLEQLLLEYHHFEDQLTVASLEESRHMIEGYLNQARFGLARLHDSSN